MENIKKKYEDALNEREKIIKKIKALKKDPNVKKYIELIQQSDLLFSKQYYLCQRMQMEQLKKCNHLFVYTEAYGNETHLSRNCGCVKCGLNTNVLNHNKQDLTVNEQLMREYLINNPLENYNMTDILCDFDLAKSIYFKILKVYPNITNEEATRYLEMALYNIRNTEVNKKREKSRAKRLGLHKDFNKWNEQDVVKYR